MPNSPRFRGAGFDCSLLSFLEIDRDGSVNVSKLGIRPHVTAGAGGTVGSRRAGTENRLFRLLHRKRAGLAIANSALAIEKEGKVKKLVEKVEQVSFSRRAAKAQAGDRLYA